MDSGNRSNRLTDINVEGIVQVGPKVDSFPEELSLKNRFYERSYIPLVLIRSYMDGNLIRNNLQNSLWHILF